MQDNVKIFTVWDPTMLTVGAFSVLDRDGLIVSSVCSVKYGDGYVMHAVYIVGLGWLMSAV